MDRIMRMYNPGHGGGVPLSRGVYKDVMYLVRGKRSFLVPPGILEGVFNRLVLEQIIQMEQDDGKLHVPLVRGPMDPTVLSRAMYANRLIKESMKADSKIVGATWTGIHANAARLAKNDVWSPAHGFTIWCHPKSEKGKLFAELLEKNMATNLDGMIESRGIKYSRWFKEMWMPKMPSAIVECGFMTNELEASLLAQTKTEIFIAGAIKESNDEYERIITS